MRLILRILALPFVIPWRIVTLPLRLFRPPRPTARQLAFIAELVAERQGTSELAKHRPRTRAEASALIDEMLKRPRRRQ